MTRPGVFLVFSRPTSPEQEEAYNIWYDEHHVPDSLLLPGFRRGRRYKIAEHQLMPIRPTEPGFDYVAIYDVDDIDSVPDAAALMPKLASVSRSEPFISPAMDSPNMRAFVLEEIFDCDRPSPLPDGVTSLQD